MQTNILADCLVLVHPVRSPMFHLGDGECIQEVKYGDPDDNPLILVGE
jgi:hypothetical protein